MCNTGMFCFDRRGVSSTRFAHAFLYDTDSLHVFFMLSCLIHAVYMFSTCFLVRYRQFTCFLQHTQVGPRSDGPDAGVGPE